MKDNYYGKFGHPAEETSRWRRIVELLDEKAGNWRVHPEYLGDMAYQAISSALSRPEKSESRGQKAADLTLKLASKHGREAAVAVLAEFGVKRVSELRLEQVASYLSRVTTALEQPVDTAPDQAQWDSHAKHYPATHKSVIRQLSRGKVQVNLPPRYRLDFETRTERNPWWMP